MDAVWSGLQQCYAALAAEVQQRYDVELTAVGALGVSAMMHGYLAFDADGELLTPFRTWRNTNTGEAAERAERAVRATTFPIGGASRTSSRPS